MKFYNGIYHILYMHMLILNRLQSPETKMFQKWNFRDNCRMKKFYDLILYRARYIFTLNAMKKFRHASLEFRARFARFSTLSALISQTIRGVNLSWKKKFFFGIFDILTKKVQLKGLKRFLPKTQPTQTLTHPNLTYRFHFWCLRSLPKRRFENFTIFRNNDWV